MKFSNIWKSLSTHALFIDTAIEISVALPENVNLALEKISYMDAYMNTNTYAIHAFI